AVEAYHAYLEALQASQPLKGGMHWKKIKGREYLYKYRDRYGHGHSLGPRSPHTEPLWAEFGRQRREVAALLGARRQQLAEAARFCRAALIHRVPEPVTRILRRLTPGDLTHAPLMVIDTHALHAFEFAAGVFIGTDRDSPCFSGTAQQLTLAATADVSPDTFLRLLRQADRSYKTLPGDGLAAVNQQGFRVRLLRPPTAPSGHRMVVRNAPGVTVPAESGDLAALMGAPKFSQVVIGRRGDPVTMVVPDPRALALHKLWLSQQADREPGKQTRDRCQAAALAELILRYLPQYYFFSAELQLFPAEVARLAENLVEGYESTADLEAD
ncbi:MAG: GSU2403 family nucleotidyltransferase fold protein, partial [Deltaproteobacteria bacterium]|nr:GSU2403 family nucleotidyltransferase fold protein [Deltaproteobacteria bacterium]